MKGLTDPVRRKVGGGERSMLMLPFNVIMVAKIRGHVDSNQLKTAIGKLRVRHALLAVKVDIDENDVAYFVDQGVPDPDLEVLDRHNENHWIERAEAEFTHPFSLETGPLARFILLQSDNIAELIVSAHHAVCDGTSMIYLIRDIVAQLGTPEKSVEALAVPAVIDRSTVPSPPPVRPVQRILLGFLNKKWEKKRHCFDYEDRKRFHSVFWKKNRNKRLLAWILSKDETTTLVEQCRKNDVTVNSALWAAFLAAQHDVQSPLKAYHRNVGMAVSTRDKLSVPIGEALGFYASSLTVKLTYDPRLGFWENTEIIHRSINHGLEKTQLFRMLAADLLSPTLLDSLYFSKYGLIKSRISNVFVKMMNFNKVSYGYSITNVGKMNIPTSYGALDLEEVYGPAVYSDVNEKLIGVVTVGGKVSFMMTYNEDNLGPDQAEQIRVVAMQHLLTAVGR